MKEENTMAGGGGMVPKSVGLQRLPHWDLAASHSQLQEQFEQTRVMFMTYESYLSDLLAEYAQKKSKRKAQTVEAAAGDVRMAYSQLVAIGSCFRQKSKDAEAKREVKEVMEKAQQEHAMLQGKADEVAEGEQGAREEEERGRGGREERKGQMKPVKELEPSTVAHFKLSGAELERWSKEMEIWSIASGFKECAKEVQCAFAAKFAETEMVEKIQEEAELDGISLDFKTFVEKVKELCQSQSYLFVRRVDFFLMKNKDTSAKGFLEYMYKILKEHKTAEIAAMASDAKTYSVYKVLSEMPATLRNRVVHTMEREMSFEELRAELEKVASLKTMEEAVGGKKVNRLAKTDQTGEPPRQQGGGGGGAKRGWPEGFDPSMFGCLRCGKRTDPPHEARNCTLQRKDLVCTYCGMKQSHVEEVCFKKLEAEGKLVAKQPARSTSPAGGRPLTQGPARSATPGPVANKIVLRRVNKLKMSNRREDGTTQQTRVCKIRTGEAADGLPRRSISLWRGGKGARLGEPDSQVEGLCDSGSNAAVINKETFDKVGGQLKVFTQDTVKLASTSGQELPILGAVDIWVKLENTDRYKRKLEALVVDGIDEEFILGVNELKLLGLLDQEWPYVEVKQTDDEERKIYSLRQAELTEEEELQEKVDMMEDTEEECPEGETEEVAEGVWEVEQDEHTVEDIPGLGLMPESVQQVLRAHKEVFSNRLRKDLNWPEQDIELVPGLPELPRQATKAKRIPARFFENAWKQIQALQHQKIIAKLNGIPPADAVVCSAFWTQKAGAPPDVGRMVCDSRPLNAIIRRGHHPSYDPASLIRGMHPRIRCYWKCDLAQAFYQCRISEASSKKYLNFLCEFGYFRFLKSVMGMSTSSSTLGQALDAKTGHLVATKKLIRDADDYLGGGESEEEACEILGQFLEVCEAEGITLSPKKFQWGGLDKPLSWAGLVVQKGGARPDEKRIEAVRCFPQPDNVKSLRSWIALVNQLGYHVEGLSAKTALQRELLKKGVAWNWTEKHKEEFLAVREEVGNPNTLWHYDGNMDLGLSIDTQRTNGPNSTAVAGLGFVCFNYYRDPVKAEESGLGGPLHPRSNRIRALQYGSIAAKEAWRSKPPVVVEGIGALAALYRLNYFCRGQAVIDVFLDSKTLVEAWCNKGLEDMAPGLQDLMIELARWPLRMHYCEKNKHVIPDALGRNCVEGEEGYDQRLEEVEGLVEYPRLVGVVPEEENSPVRLQKLVQELQEDMEESWEDNEEEVEDKQSRALALAMAGVFEAAEEDEAYRKVCEWVQQGKTKAEVVKAGKTNPVHHFKQWWDDLSVLEEPGEGKPDGAKRKVMIYGDNKLVVPKAMTSGLVELAHQPHKGEQITLAFLKRYYVWQGMNNQVRQRCRECLSCSTYVRSRPKEVEVAMTRRPPRPWFSVGLDFFSYEGDHIMMVVDYLTSYMIVHTFKSTPSARQTVDALDEICRQNGGYFSILASDGGSQMTSELFQQWLRDKFIVHRLSSATAAWSNGKVEQAIGQLRQSWDRAQQQKGSRLSKGERAEALAILNDSPRRVGAASPARLHFRRQYRHPGAPAMDLVVCSKEEERIEWECKADRKEAANRRTATNQKKPLQLRVGLKVLVEDKEGNNTLPGEIVGVRSQRSCWVKMDDSGRTLLRNRKFLESDPSFHAGETVVNSLKCMKAQALGVVKAFVETQQSGIGSQPEPEAGTVENPVHEGQLGSFEAQPVESSLRSQLPGSSRLAEEAMEILGQAAAAHSECMQARAALLVQQLLRVLAAAPAVRGGSSKETAGSRKVRFSDEVSFMEGHHVPDLREVIKKAVKSVAEPALGRTVSFDEDVCRQVVFVDGGLGQRLVKAGAQGRELSEREAVQVWLDQFEGPAPPAHLVAQLREAGLATRAKAHDIGCESCAGLSAVVPSYVRRCELESEEDQELFIAWGDFVSVPGRELLAFFQSALDGLAAQQAE